MGVVCFWESIDQQLLHIGVQGVLMFLERTLQCWNNHIKTFEEYLLVKQLRGIEKEMICSAILIEFWSIPLPLQYWVVYIQSCLCTSRQLPELFEVLVCSHMLQDFNAQSWEMIHFICWCGCNMNCSAEVVAMFPSFPSVCFKKHPFLEML